LGDGWDGEIKSREGGKNDLFEEQKTRGNPL